MGEISLGCRCGKMKGIGHDISPETGTHVVCYCDDCQAFAQFLGVETTDKSGGTGIFQLTPAQVEITEGAEYLASMRLSPKGLIRWYSSCCNTPIGNTSSAALPFVGLLHDFIHSDADSEKQLGPIRFYIFGKYAIEQPSTHEIHKSVPFALLVRTVPKMLWAKVQGRTRPSPFFDKAGAPVSDPVIHS